MARELSEDDYDKWQKRFEEKREEIDSDGEDTTVSEHDGGKVMLGDRSDDAEEWLKFDREGVEEVLKP